MKVYYEVGASYKLRIAPESVIHETDDFIVVLKKSTENAQYYERINKENLEILDGEKETRERIPIEGKTPKTKIESPKNEKKKAIPKYNYTFGLEDVRVYNTVPQEVAGYISPPIYIGVCDCIKLSTTLDVSNLNIETFIVDGTEEYPILIDESTKESTIPKTYSPINTSVRIKVIYRRTNTHEIPPAISSMHILRYGGKRLWDK